MIEFFPGDPLRPGATVMEGGVNFALFSAHAEAVELCLFEEDGSEKRVLMQTSDDHWHLFVAGIGAGQQYAYRVHGAWLPDNGYRFNPAKIMLDPYARATTGLLTVHASHYDYQLDGDKNLVRDVRDNAQHMPRCVVTEAVSGLAVARSKTRLQDSLLYELHVKGFTQAHPGVAEALRGKYAGLGSAEVVDYIRSLGVTSIELLPVQEFVDEPFVIKKGLVNYWGYNPMLYFMPTSRYAQADAVSEFKTMVRTFHDANIEVILDVVYNHTAEADGLGPSLCYRGIDNLSYYRLDESNRANYINESGCGNSLNVAHPAVLKMVTDSLRFWTSEMGVDGFRFDLATGLGRTREGFSPDAAFFQAVYQDPVLCRARMIAEPWDMGLGGYQLGNFPSKWSEWNDRYRDTVRRYWRGDGGVMGDFARHLHGSSGLFDHRGRPPQASINFITSHDGFTLRDLVSYEQKHNEANLEDNRDGHDHNYAFNCGVEGETEDEAIAKLRIRQQKNLIMTLLVSQGVPMLLAGDEIGRTQQGNNNSYCQDSEINWINWELAEMQGGADLLTFTRLATSLRTELRELRCDRYIHGADFEVYDGIDEIAWYHPRGSVMLDADWRDANQKAVGLMLHGEEIFESEGGNLVFVWFNAHDEQLATILPTIPREGSWLCRLSTMDSEDRMGQTFNQAESLALQNKSAELYVFKGEIKE